MKDYEVMKATAHRVATHGFSHEIDVRSHRLLADEARDVGGEDEGPNPQELLAASLASCTAITMEMYAKRKGWDIGPVEVAVEDTPPERGCPTKFKPAPPLPNGCSEGQIDRLRVIAAKGPVHPT